MSMRAPVTDLPIMLDEVSFASGGVTILDRVSLAFAAGAPAVLMTCTAPLSRGRISTALPDVQEA